MLYAMCGFAHFGSLGIMIGGPAPWPPSAASRANSLGLKSIVQHADDVFLMVG